MKTILAVWNVGGKGKSNTLREVANLLISSYPNLKPIEPAIAKVPITGDFRLVIEINGTLIGIESKGDPNTMLEDRLIELSDKYKCEIIICTCRTRGDTVFAVEKVGDSRGFQKIWTSTYQIADKAKHSLFNQIKAKHILDLLLTLKLI